MIITKRSLSRRTLLRGAGAALALPLPDAMVPALSAMAKTAASPVRRFSVVYVPNGMAMQYWTPAKVGALEMTPVLLPLAGFRNQMLVLSGLDGPENGGQHADGSTLFLTGAGVPPRSSSAIEASVSIDQMAAKEFGKHTQLASVEISLDGRSNAGQCNGGYSCAYTNTIAWSGPSTPLPMEHNPRAIFERLFGDTTSTGSAAQHGRIAQDRSILDAVKEKVGQLQRGLGPRDRAKITQFLDGVRDVERRIQKAEEQSTKELPVVEQPAGIPNTFAEHAKLMFDLQVLAYQCDLTRVTTFMFGRELTGRTYPEIGVPDAHHPLSHHFDDPTMIATMSKINVYHATLFAEYLEKLRATPDGDGSLLDHMLILYGGGISNSNSHSHIDLPVALVGGAWGQLTGGRHIRYRAGTPMANLLVTVMGKLGLRVDTLPNSNGKAEVDAVAL
jgi:hypothetical protein